MKRTLILTYFLLTAFQMTAQRSVIWCGVLIDGKKVEPRKNMTIVVSKNRIESVNEGFPRPDPGDRVIDLKTGRSHPAGSTCM